jgi:hypothetical protein
MNLMPELKRDFMSKIFLKMSIGLLAAGLTLAASAAVPGSVKQLHGHVPKVVFQLKAIGQYSATNRMHLALGLPLHNQAGLDALTTQFRPAPTIIIF